MQRKHAFSFKIVLLASLCLTCGSIDWPNSRRCRHGCNTNFVCDAAVEDTGQAGRQVAHKAEL